MKMNPNKLSYLLINIFPAQIKSFLSVLAFLLNLLQEVHN
jgi:hypothetical protein